MSHILALDVGTSSVRAAIYDEHANVLPETVVKLERSVEFTDDGGAQIGADEGLLQVCTAIDEVLAKFTGSIGHVAMSCFWHSLVGIDAAGNPTTPVYTWAEKRPADFVRNLRNSLDESAVHNRTGARFHSSFWTAKLLWLKATQPDAFGETAKWLSFSDYLALRLFNESVTSVSMASGTGIFDQRQCSWDEPLSSYFDLPQSALPRIAEDNETFQTTRWERLKESQWFPAIGDGAANNIGAGCVQNSKAALMIGTSGAMRVAYEGDVPDAIPEGLWCYRIDRRRIIVGGALSDGGGLYRWLKDTLKIADVDDEVEAEIRKRDPDSHGLTFLPFLAGERSTGYHEDATGAILGLTQYTSAVEITQAAMESVAYRFAKIVEDLRTFTDPGTIIASGGALRESPVWTQIIADVLAKDLTLPDTREASSRGVVLLALESLGKINNIADSRTPDGVIFSCNTNRSEIYKRARIRHEHFYKKLIADESAH